MTDLPNTNSILSYLHCRQCIEEVKAGAAIGMSPAEYQQLEIGWTKPGLQVWCRRHQSNVVHIDFEGQRHPANTTRATAQEDVS